MPAPVNAFEIKRAAHSASRTNPNGESNFKTFFRHVFMGKSKPEPWTAASQLESQCGATTDADSDGHDAATASSSPLDPSEASAVRRRNTRRNGDLSPSQAEPKKDRTFFKHLTPKEPFTVRNQIRRTLFNSWLNVLLVAAPVGIAINYVDSVGGVAVFIVNFIAIIPLAAMLSFATEEIALRTGETLGGLLNATFGYEPFLFFGEFTLGRWHVRC
jgi:Ca2+:H+ antiporter